MKEKAQRFAPIVIIVLILIASIVYLASTSRESNELSASGTIEATEILISAELGGLVADVLVE